VLPGDKPLPKPFYAFIRTCFMTTDYEPLAIKFAPELYYAETDDPFRNISPEDMGGFYWRAVESPTSSADVCIQYIIYFKQQRWDSSILDKFLGRPVGSHPNDFVPIFLFLKDEKPIKAVFDIWHYDLVGEINTSTAFLRKEKGPLFQVKNYYRGLMPVEKVERYESLNDDLELLDRKLLKEWYKGRTFEGNYVEEAKFVIANKLDDPFQRVTTFRDRSGLAGTFIEALIYTFKWRGWPGIEIRGRKSGQSLSYIVSLAIELGKTQGITDVRKVKKEDAEKLAEFIRDNILEEPRMLDYLVLSKWEDEKSYIKRILYFLAKLIGVKSIRNLH